MFTELGRDPNAKGITYFNLYIYNCRLWDKIIDHGLWQGSQKVKCEIEESQALETVDKVADSYDLWA